MKQPYLKNRNFRLVICFTLLCGAFIIHSCKKDNSKTPSTTTNAAVSAAKAWYESAYPVNANGSKLATQGVNGANGNGQGGNAAFDYSQAIKPDWGHASTYTRLGKNVIEMPIDPSGTIYSALAGSATGPGIYPKENSRSSFILLSDGKGYDAYIMTILADPSYLKNDKSKLAKNTYRKHDADFTGFVFYFTPKGQYSGGYEFKDGQLLTPVAQNTPSNGKTIQSAGTSNLKIAVGEPPSYDCTFYYMLTVDQYGNVIDQTFLYAECTPNPGTDPGSPGTGGPGGSPPVPPKCIPATGSSGDESVQSLIINVTTPPPGGDGGMPPPAPIPCNVTVPETEGNTVKKDTITNLMKNASSLTIQQIDSLQAVLNQIVKDCLGQGLYNYFTGNSTTFGFLITPSSSYSAFYNVATGNITIKNLSTLTPAMLQEEFFHAYQNLTISGGAEQYAGKAGDANIEFEAKLLKDIQYNLDPTQQGNDPALGSAAYNDFLQSITNNYTSFPTSFNASQLSTYFTLMAQFIQSGSGYSNDIINPSLNPTAMFELINSSPCSTQ